MPPRARPLTRLPHGAGAASWIRRMTLLGPRGHRHRQHCAPPRPRPITSLLAAGPSRRPARTSFPGTGARTNIHTKNTSVSLPTSCCCARTHRYPPNRAGSRRARAPAHTLAAHAAWMLRRTAMDFPTSASAVARGERRRPKVVGVEAVIRRPPRRRAAARPGSPRASSLLHRLEALSDHRVKAYRHPRERLRAVSLPRRSCVTLPSRNHPAPPAQPLATDGGANRTDVRRRSSMS